jgi:hypothetical protein
LDFSSSFIGCRLTRISPICDNFCFAGTAVQG